MQCHIMKSLSKKIITLAIFTGSLSVSTAQALVVDFEQFAGLPAGFVPSAFLEVPDYSSANQTLTLSNQTFGNEAGITFSGGLLLDEPIDSSGMPGNTINGDGGSIYYGTAFSPTTSINTSNYQNQLTINIDESENFTNVSGELINGLNTGAPQNSDGTLASYDISFYSGDELLITDMTGDVVFDDGDSLVSFGLDTSSLSGSLFGSVITKVEIMANDLDLNSDDDQITNEWDYLLASVSFESTNPVPVPAALPLFISALLGGGFVVARPKKQKSSD